MSIIIHDEPIANTTTRTTPGVALMFAVSHLVTFALGVSVGLAVASGVFYAIVRANF